MKFTPLFSPWEAGRQHLVSGKIPIIVPQQEFLVSESCIVGIQLAAMNVRALEVNIVSAGDVYIKYSMDGLPEAHASYHASGQQHIKKGGKYVEWNAGQGGTFVPMKVYRAKPEEVITRSDCGSTVGWEVPKLAIVLAVLNEPADTLVDARGLRDEAILAFKVEVVGRRARPRRSVSGFPILKSHRFTAAVEVEINAFVLSDDGRGAAWTETF